MNKITQKEFDELPATDGIKKWGLRVRVWVILYLLEHACKYFQPEVVLIAEPI